jgi:hypothetical protein
LEDARESEQQLGLKQKLLFALTAYVVLAALAWTTLSNEPIQAGVFRIELRTLTVVVLGLFAFRTLMGYWRRKIDEERESKR